MNDQLVAKTSTW